MDSQCASSWSSFLNTGTPPPLPPSYPSSSTSSPQYNSSNPLRQFGHSSSSSRTRTQQQPSSAFSLSSLSTVHGSSVPSTPISQRNPLKRTRDADDDRLLDDDADDALVDTHAALFPSSSSMDDSTTLLNGGVSNPPPMHRFVSLPDFPSHSSSTESASAHTTPMRRSTGSLVPPNKKQCQALSINTTANATQSASNSPFLRVQAPAYSAFNNGHFPAPSSSLPTSLAASPLLRSSVPTLGFHSSPGNQAHMLPPTVNMNTPGTAQRNMQQQYQQQQITNPHTPQQATSNSTPSSCLSVATFPFLQQQQQQQQQQYPSQPPLQSHHSEGDSSVLNNQLSLDSSFRPCSAPLHRPMESIVLPSSVQPSQHWHLNLSHVGDMEDAARDNQEAHSTTLSSPPSSPVANFDRASLPLSERAHPSTPSRSSPSHCSSSAATHFSTSMPPLHRMSSAGGGADNRNTARNGSGSGSASMGHNNAVSVPSSLQSSLPSSPTTTSRISSAFPTIRSTSPSFHSTHTHNLSASATTLSSMCTVSAAAPGVSSFHTPTSSPLFLSHLSDGLPTPEIGQGELLMDHCIGQSAFKQNTTQQTATAQRTFQQITSAGINMENSNNDDMQGMED